MTEKERLAEAVLSRFLPGQVVGVGHGSTVEAVLARLKVKLAAEPMELFAIPVSMRSAAVAEETGMTVLAPQSQRRIDWAFDGADEVDSQLRLTKGGGAALLGEKIIARRAGGIVVLINEKKLVPQLGLSFPIPVEVISIALEDVERALPLYGATKIVRRAVNGVHSPAYTERGNMLLDVTFNTIPESLERDLKGITGVVESGLFFGLTKEVLVASESGVRSLTYSGSSTVSRAL